MNILQGCDKVVTRLWQGCSKVVTRLWQGCGKVVTRLQGLHNLVTTLSFLYGYGWVAMCTEDLIIQCYDISYRLI